MNIRKSKKSDINEIMRLIHQAQKYFKNNGIDQWQDNYPQDIHILEDILQEKSYVLDNDHIVGTMYFAIENEPTYNSIDGQWLQDNSYGVIHRIVVDESYKGQNLAKRLLDYAIEECLSHQIYSIRIDTHHDNLSMQRFLKKNGFIACGKITLESGAPRIGFEKILNK